MAVLFLVHSYSNAQIVVGPISNPHPRLFMNSSEIEAMKIRVASNREPWKTAFVNLQARATAASSRDPRPYTGTDPNTYGDYCRADAARARDLALMYHITGSDIYVRYARDYLMSWATATPLPASNLNKASITGMLIGRATLPMMWAYDLLYNHPLMTGQIKATIENWFKSLEIPIKSCKEYWHENDYFNKQYYQNHLVAHTMGLLAIGYTIGDVGLVQFAVDHPDNSRDFVELVQGCIFMPGDQPCSREYDQELWPVQKGEIYDRYRHQTAPEKGLQYSHLTMRLLTLTAEMALHNGLDFFHYTAPTGEKLELPITFYADFHRLKDACIKGGYYCSYGYDETPRIGIPGDNTSFWEIAFKYYPYNVEVAELLGSIDRTAYPKLDSIIGDPVLTHGRKICWEGRQSVDINYDCIVNFEDMMYLAQNWLKCSLPFQEGCVEGDILISD